VWVLEGYSCHTWVDRLSGHEKVTGIEVLLTCCMCHYFLKWKNKLGGQKAYGHDKNNNQKAEVISHRIRRFLSVFQERGCHWFLFLPGFVISSSRPHHQHVVKLICLSGIRRKGGLTWNHTHGALEERLSRQFQKWHWQTYWETWRTSWELSIVCNDVWYDLSISYMMPTW